MLAQRGLCGLYARCLSVRLYVTRRYCVKTVKRIIKLFFISPSGSHTILVFRTKRYGNNPTQTSYAWGYEKNRDL